MNKVLLLGRLAKNPEVKQANNGTLICNITIAVKKREGANFINLVAFNKIAENINKFFTKGRMISIEGRIENNNYKKDGKTVYNNQIIIDSFYFCDSAKKEELPF